MPKLLCFKVSHCFSFILLIFSKLYENRAISLKNSQCDLLGTTIAAEVIIIIMYNSFGNYLSHNYIEIRTCTLECTQLNNFLVRAYPQNPLAIKLHTIICTA